MQKIILFGAGYYLAYRINQLLDCSDVEILYILDNDESKDGTYFRGIPVKYYRAVITDEYDYVVISTTYAVEVEKQLLEMGVLGSRIKRLKEFLEELYFDKPLYYNAASIQKRDEKKEGVCVVHCLGDFNGACLAAVYMLEIFKKKGFHTGFVVPVANDKLVQMLLEKGIDVCIHPAIEALGEDFEWFDKYDTVIVNTLSLHRCLPKFRKKRVIWWIHESQSQYNDELKIWGALDEKQYRRAKVLCVSDVALGNFNKFFPNLKADKMEYGIPDFFLEKKPLDNNKIVFATVGYIYAGKGQDILLKAIKALDKDVLNKCEFWIIGAPENQAYMASLLEQMKGYPVVHIEKVAHDEMIQLYKKIDVVVCPSRQDSLPIVMTEAFMNYKIAIMSDVVGTTKYVENEKQAFIFKSGDDKELSSIIRQVVLNFEKLDDLRDAGRRVYDDVFSMSAFEKRISSQIVSLE